MKISHLLVSVGILFSMTVVAANTILTQNVRIYSEDRGCYANIATTVDRQVELSVYKGDSIYPNWTSWLEWGRGYAGFMSNDGSVFIAVNEEYSEYRSLMMVYYRDKQESYTVKSIPVAKEHLKLQGGKFLWIDLSNIRGRFLYDASGKATSFELVLIDSRVIGVELKQ